MNEKKYLHVTHEFAPVFDEESEVLILGSLPSVASREQKFYYAHPQNRFWKMLALIKKEELPQTIEEKKRFLQRNKIALWDVIAACDIAGSSDSSIKNVVANDMSVILCHTKVKKILLNGTKAYELFLKYCKTDLEVIKLPSTSPANAAWSMQRLEKVWGEALEME